MTTIRRLATSTGTELGIRLTVGVVTYVGTFAVLFHQAVSAAGYLG